MPDLTGIELKLQRADAHLEDLDRSVTAFLDDINAKPFGVELDPRKRREAVSKFQEELRSPILRHQGGPGHRAFEDHGLGDRLSQLAELDDDRQSLLHMLDALLTRKRLRILASDSH